MSAQATQQRTTRPRGVPGVFHVESYVDSRTGDPILIKCFCAIGYSHSYADWAKRYRRPGSED